MIGDRDPSLGLPLLVTNEISGLLTLSPEGGSFEMKRDYFRVEIAHSRVFSGGPYRQVLLLGYGYSGPFSAQSSTFAIIATSSGVKGRIFPGSREMEKRPRSILV